MQRQRLRINRLSSNSLHLLKRRTLKQLGADTAFQRGQSKIQQRQSPLILTMKKYSVFKITVYRRTDHLLESQKRNHRIIVSIEELLAWIISGDQSECTNIFHRKTKSLAKLFQYYRDKLLARDQVFFVQFLLIDIKHDTVSNCRKITFC